MDKVEPCTSCGELIFPATAEQNDGLCTPCLEEVHDDSPEKGWPNLLAFQAAACLLLASAGFTLFQIYFEGSSFQYIGQLAIKVTLALFLLQQNEAARLVALIMAAIGLVVPVMLRALDDSVSGGVMEIAISQALFCGALILFLGWETVRWRLFLGGTMGLLYTMYLGLIVVTLGF